MVFKEKKILCKISFEIQNWYRIEVSARTSKYYQNSCSSKDHRYEDYLCNLVPISLETYIKCVVKF